jgi:hypothetical protein
MATIAAATGIPIPLRGADATDADGRATASARGAPRGRGRRLDGGRRQRRRRFRSGAGRERRGRRRRLLRFDGGRRRFRGCDAGRDVRQPRFRRVVAPCLLDERRAHLAGAGGERGEERGVAEDVHDARDAGAEVRHALEGGGAEQVRAGRSRALEPAADVGRDLDRGERPDAQAERDALAQLAERGVGERLVELGLSGEHDLQIFARSRGSTGAAAPRDVRPESCASSIRSATFPPALVLGSGTVQALEEDELPPPSGGTPSSRRMCSRSVEADGRIQQEDGLRVGSVSSSRRRSSSGARLTDERDEALRASMPYASGRERLLQQSFR